MANSGVDIDGGALRALRVDRMWSLQRLARQGRDFAASIGENSGLAGPTLCRAELGEHDPSRDTLRYVVGALCPTMAELHALLKGATPPKALVELCSDAPRAAPDGPTLPAAGEDDDMDRRYVLRGSAAAGLLAALAALEKLVGVLPAEALGRLADDRHPVDGGLVALYESTADAAFRAYADPSVSRDGLLRVVTDQAAAVRAALRGPMTPGLRARLYAVAVGLHTEGGLLAFHRRELGVADELFTLARGLAADSGEDRLQAQALWAPVITFNSTQFGGQRQDLDALALVRAENAAAHAANADPYTYGEVLRVLSTARARTGDGPGFQEAFERAHAASERVDGSEVGFWSPPGHLRPVFLHRSAGFGHLAGQRTGEARGEFRRVLADPGCSAGLAMQVRADMARAWALDGQPEPACADLGGALDSATARRDRMGVQRICGVRAGFPPEWSLLACVRDLDERLVSASI